jgi:hypothetical protein
MRIKETASLVELVYIVNSFSKSSFAKTVWNLLLYDSYKIIFDIICPRKITVLLKKIMNWFNHDIKMWNKPTDEVNNPHKILNLLLGSGSRKIKDGINPFGINAYSQICDNVSKELALTSTYDQIWDGFLLIFPHLSVTISVKVETFFIAISMIQVYVETSTKLSLHVSSPSILVNPMHHRNYDEISSHLQ